MSIVDVLELVVVTLLYVGSVLLVGLRIPQSQLSEFELERRREQGDPQAIFGAKRHAAYLELVSLRWVATLLIGLAIGLLLYHVFTARSATLLVLIGLLLVGPLARLGAVRRVSQRLYRKYELHLIHFVMRTKRIWQIVAPPSERSRGAEALASREELAHIIHTSDTVISREEISLVEHALQFYGRDVADIMTAAADIISVPASEILGPLVVDELHKSGHTIFPVQTVGGEYVGLLDISGFASLHRHDSPAARDVMHSDVVHVRHDESLDEALRVFVDSKQVCLLVDDDDGVTIGMISIGDVVRALTGWQRRH